MPVPAVEERPAPAPYRVETGPGWTLTLADCMDPIHGLPALTDGAVTHCITDPPYGERTHAKQAHGRRGKGYRDSWVTTVGLGYAHLDPGAVAPLAAQFTRVAEKWALVMTSHDLCPAWEAALGRYTFAPLPIVMPGMTVRLAGDGPSSWTVWLMVNRPRGLIDGTKPGAYVVQPGSGSDRAANPIKGHKPLELMERIVADYTAQGDLIADPFTGSGTTGVACVHLGRRFQGWERDPATFEVAVKRLRAAREQLRIPLACEPVGKQAAMFDAAPLRREEGASPSPAESATVSKP